MAKIILIINFFLILGEELLTPTKIYVKSVLPALKSGKVKAFAHITGGGLVENIPRILPAAVKVRLDACSWEILPVFSWLAAFGRSRPIFKFYERKFF